MSTRDDRRLLGPTRDNKESPNQCVALLPPSLRPKISCSTNTHVLVTPGVTVEITSAEAATKLNNVKFELQDGSTFVSSVPQLDWTSVETEPVGRKTSALSPATADQLGRINGINSPS